MRNKALEESITRRVVLLTAERLSTLQIAEAIGKSQSFVYRIQKTPMFKAALAEVLDSTDEHYVDSMLSEAIGDPTRFHARQVLAPKALSVVGQKLDSADEKIQLAAVGMTMDIARHGVSPTRSTAGVTINNQTQSASFALSITQEQTNAILKIGRAHV